MLTEDKLKVGRQSINANEDANEKKAKIKTWKKEINDTKEICNAEAITVDKLEKLL